MRRTMMKSKIHRDAHLEDAEARVLEPRVVFDSANRQVSVETAEQHGAIRGVT